MTGRLPDFVLIGAMKCATTTLDLQLGRQDGVFMAGKELGFFSDDEAFARGLDGYAEQFAAAPADAIAGEASTDYTKLPTYPHAAERLAKALPDAKLIYMIRHPVKRLVSHYVHDWTERRISEPIDRAVEVHPELVDYGRYAMQLEPYLDRVGPERILVVFFERLTAAPEEELARVGRFLGAREPLVWREEEAHANASRDRLRKSRVRDAIVWNPVSTWLRRHLLPQGVRDKVKGLWQMKERPELSPAAAERVVGRFDEDLAKLGKWLDVDLSCETFADVAKAGAPEWAREVRS